MFFNKFFLMGGGIAVFGTGTGLGVYYGTQGSNQTKSSQETKVAETSGGSLFRGTGRTGGESDRPGVAPGK